MIGPFRRKSWRELCREKRPRLPKPGDSGWTRSNIVILITASTTLSVFFVVFGLAVLFFVRKTEFYKDHFDHVEIQASTQPTTPTLPIQDTALAQAPKTLHYSVDATMTSTAESTMNGPLYRPLQNLP